MSILLNFPAGEGGLGNIDKVTEWLENNSDVARWVRERPIEFDVVENKVFLSSIEIDNEEDATYCCLRFGLCRY